MELEYGFRCIKGVPHVASQAMLFILMGFAPTREGKLLLAVRREVCLYAQEFHPVDMSLKKFGDADADRMNRLTFRERRSLDPAIT